MLSRVVGRVGAGGAGGGRSTLGCKCRGGAGAVPLGWTGYRLTTSGKDRRAEGGKGLHEMSRWRASALPLSAPRSPRGLRKPPTHSPGFVPPTPSLCAPRTTVGELPSGAQLGHSPVKARPPVAAGAAGGLWSAALGATRVRRRGGGQRPLFERPRPPGAPAVLPSQCSRPQPRRGHVAPTTRRPARRATTPSPRACRLTRLPCTLRPAGPGPPTACDII